MRLREFKERQRLDEFAPAAIPLWFALTALLGGAAMSWNSMTDKQKKDSATWFKNNYNNNKATVKKVLPYLTPGYGTAISPNTKVGVEKLKPIINNPEQFNLGIDNKKLPQPGNINKDRTNKDIKNTQPTPLVQPDGSTGSAPSVLDNITSWFKDTFGSDTKKTAPVDQVDKKILAPSSKNKKVNPAYKVPTINAPVDNGDGTVTWNGQTYDKVFDKTKIAQINKSIIDNQKRRQQGQISKSVGVDGSGAGTVSGGKDKGKDGGALGGNIGTDIPWDGGVSGSSSKGKSIGSTDKGDGTITGPEIGVKGQTGVGQGTASGTKGEVIPGTNIGTNTVTGANTIAGNPAVPIARTTTVPPGFIPPPIAQLPKTDPKYRKFDPKKDQDIIYKGKKFPPDKISKFKAGKMDADYFDKFIRK